jgi:hypothetical protein
VVRTVGSYPIVTFQYSPTASSQVPYHIRYLFFESDTRISPQACAPGTADRDRNPVRDLVVQTLTQTLIQLSS